MGITRAVTTTTTAVIHLTGRLTTLGDRTTTAAIELTGIISIITTATKSGQVGVRARLISWLGATPSQLFLSEPEASAVKASRSHGETDEVREAPSPILQITRQR